MAAAQSVARCLPATLANIGAGSVESTLIVEANVGAMRRARSVRPYEGGSRRMPAPHEPSRSAVSLPADVGTSFLGFFFGVPKRRRAMPPLNPDLIASAAVGSAPPARLLCAAQKGEGESD